MTIDMDRFRAALQEERERVEKALASLRVELPGSPDEDVEAIAAASDNHLAETATATVGREIDYTLEGNSEEVLGQIDAALKRIDEGTYGTCSACGREIPSERLDACPWAALCIDCKREVERR